MPSYRMFNVIERPDSFVKEFSDQVMSGQACACMIIFRPMHYVPVGAAETELFIKRLYDDVAAAFYRLPLADRLGERPPVIVGCRTSRDVPTNVLNPRGLRFEQVPVIKVLFTVDRVQDTLSFAYIRKLLPDWVASETEMLLAREVIASAVETADGLLEPVVTGEFSPLELVQYPLPPGFQLT